MVLTGCTGAGDRMSEGVTVLTAWAHSGQEAERELLQRFVREFNAEHGDVRVDITFLPDGSYNAQVQAAALAGDMPDLLEFDGPFLYNYAWQGRLYPLDDLLPEGMRENVIDTILAQGTYHERLYSLGMYDSALVLYARRSMLEAVDARIPQGPDDAWTITEFNQLLADLAEKDDDGQVLDLKMNYTGEWFCYGFYASLLSGGGGLIDREDYSQAAGVLDGEASVAVMEHFQDWFEEHGYIDANVDDAAFTGGRVALSWVGHWMYPSYHEAIGDDLLVLPLPDFGEGMRTGQGSWNWGITGKCEAPRAAMRFIAYLMEEEQILAMTEANAAVPATYSAIEQAKVYAEGRPRHLFVQQLTGGHAVPRPRTPAYSVITDAFQSAFHDIANGADVRHTLGLTASTIDRDIETNQGYPFLEDVQPELEK